MSKTKKLYHVSGVIQYTIEARSAVEAREKALRRADRNTNEHRIVELDNIAPADGSQSAVDLHSEAHILDEEESEKESS